MTSAVDFFLIGAQKCATSWLYYCLREHPQIQLHRKKDEEDYFGGPRHMERGDAWFESLYVAKPGARVRGAVSVDYLYDAAALRQCTAAYPAARFIACLRNPFERSASAWHWLARAGQVRANGLNEGLRAALDAFAQPEGRPPAAGIIERSLYARQLQPLAETGALARLLVVGYEQLCAQPRDTLRRIYGFAGVHPDFEPPSLSRRPKRSANLPLLTGLERLAPGSRVMGKLMDHANQWACRLGLDRPRALYAPDVYAALHRVFAPDVAALDALLGSLPPAQVVMGGRAAGDWLRPVSAAGAVPD